MTALWAADCSVLSLHPGDRLPCKVASLCMSASDGEMIETKCYLSAISVRVREGRGGDVCIFSFVDTTLIIPVSSKIWKYSGIMMCQGIGQSDSAAKLREFIRSGLDTEPGSYQIEFKQ